jgi:hypothetical protein
MPRDKKETGSVGGQGYGGRVRVAREKKGNET